MKKEEFIFFCGVEGTGHQMMLDVFSEYLKEKTNTVNRVTHNAFSSASFPYGQPRNAKRRPDISHMIKNTPKNIKLKIIVMYRDPRYVAFSGYRRGFTKDLLEQCRIVDENFRYIKKEIDKLDPSIYRLIRYEDFVENPYQYTKMLTTFLNIDKDTLEKGFKKVKQPKSSIKEKEKLLNNFFKEKDYGFENLIKQKNKCDKDKCIFIKKEDKSKGITWEECIYCGKTKNLYYPV